MVEKTDKKIEGIDKAIKHAQDEASKEVVEESSINKLSELVEKGEKVSAEIGKLLQKQEELIAKNILGGGTTHTQTEEKKEESAADYARRVEAGKI